MMQKKNLFSPQTNHAGASAIRNLFFFLFTWKNDWNSVKNILGCNFCSWSSVYKGLSNRSTRTTWIQQDVRKPIINNFAPYWNDSITQLLQTLRRHCDASHLCKHIATPLLYWDPVSAETITAQLTCCYLKRFELCDIVCFFCWQ